MGLGPAHRGVHHWWMQRLTAVALIPLSVWLFYALLHVYPLNYQDTVRWLSQPIPSILMVGTVLIGLYHQMLGLQVIIEDYVHCRTVKVTMLVFLRFVTLLLALGGLVAVLHCKGVNV